MSETEIYRTKDDHPEIEVTIDNYTAWLSQKQLALLILNSVTNINMHIKNIYKEGELENDPTVKKSLIVQMERKEKTEMNPKY